MRRTKEEAMQTREAVLNAAARILAQLGVGAFTIEAVAQEAGVTKGGVLHHFPSKEALIDSLIDQVVEGFSSRLAAELALEPAGHQGRWLRAYIRTIFAVRDDDIHLIPALANAVAGDQQKLNHIRCSIEASQQAAVEDGLDPIQAVIIRTAVDGVVFAQALGIDVLDEATKHKVYEELLRLTRVSMRHAEDIDAG